MENMKFCQSCAMPIGDLAECGTEKDGTKSSDYCQYCYEDGAFKGDMTMEQMIDFCVPFVSKGEPYKNEEEARTEMMKYFPTLKRWKK